MTLVAFGDYPVVVTMTSVAQNGRASMSLAFRNELSKRQIYFAILWFNSV